MKKLILMTLISICSLSAQERDLNYFVTNDSSLQEFIEWFEAQEPIEQKEIASLLKMRYPNLSYLDNTMGLLFFRIPVEFLTMVGMIPFSMYLAFVRALSDSTISQKIVDVGLIALGIYFLRFRFKTLKRDWAYTKYCESEAERIKQFQSYIEQYQ